MECTWHIYSGDVFMRPYFGTFEQAMNYGVMFYGRTGLKVYKYEG